MKARATFASVVAVLALTAAVVSVAASPGFAATACGGGVGQPLLLGCSENSAPITTSLTFSGGGGEALSVDAPGSGASGVFVFANNIGVYGQSSNNYGVWGTSSNSTGVYGLTAGVSTQNGVYGFANDYGGSGVYGQNDGTGYGVFGSSGSGVGVSGSTNGVATQNGVYGLANDYGGSGVYGQNNGTGYGVAGRATNVDGGTGVLGDAPNSPFGIGVEADSGPGTALVVRGKATFSRSGIVTVAAGRSSLVVTLAGVTTASMVLATAQQNKTVYVKAAVPGSGTFTIRLTGNAPTGGLKVAYFVLN